MQSPKEPRSRSCSRLAPDDPDEVGRTRQRVADALGSLAMTEASESGRALSQERAVALALEAVAGTLTLRT